jgi:hypothetical protein
MAPMNRKRGRRSTRRNMDELIAEIREARLKWEALSPEERMRAGQGGLHSTPGPRRETAAQLSILRLGAMRPRLE